MNTTVTLVYTTNNENTITGYYTNIARAHLRTERLEQKGGKILKTIYGQTPEQYTRYRRTIHYKLNKKL